VQQRKQLQHLLGWGLAVKVERKREKERLEKATYTDMQRLTPRSVKLRKEELRVGRRSRTPSACVECKTKVEHGGGDENIIEVE